MEVRIPPLPLALLEVQRKLDKQRPMRPSDIHSPYEQASSSYYVTLMTRENDSEIPSDVDLGDPTSFWWNDLEEKGGTLNDEETNLYVYVPVRLNLGCGEPESRTEYCCLEMREVQGPRFGVPYCQAGICLYSV